MTRRLNTINQTSGRFDFGGYEKYELFSRGYMDMIAGTGAVCIYDGKYKGRRINCFS